MRLATRTPVPAGTCLLVALALIASVPSSPPAERAPPVVVEAFLLSAGDVIAPPAIDPQMVLQPPETRDPLNLWSPWWQRIVGVLLGTITAL